jgi:hypothetical protein
MIMGIPGENIKLERKTMGFQKSVNQINTEANLPRQSLDSNFFHGNPPNL